MIALCLILTEERKMNKTPKILIVDDIRAAHQLYKQALKDENYEIFDAERGKDAINTIITQNLDLVILDMQLPDMSGLEVLEEIRKRRGWLPVIILTSYGSRDMVMKAAAMRINYYLVKPVDMELFRSRVRSVLNVPDDEKLNKLAQQSKELIDELNRLSVSDSFMQNINELKSQIKDIASKIQNMNKKEKTAGSGTRIEDVLWQKEVICPVCSTGFITNNYRSKSLPILKKESDFHEIYEVINPIAFDIWVCPECLYSAKKEDFDTVNSEVLEKIARDKSTRKKLAGGIDFTAVRDYDSAYMSYELAFMCYAHRKATNAFLGSLYLKYSWLARENGDKELERDQIRHVIERYEKALSIGEKITGQISELGVMYLVGELYRRNGDLDSAEKYLMKVRQSPNADGEKAILRMALDLLDGIKEEKKRNKG